MYAVTVAFTLKETAIDAFLPLVRANAKTSMAVEPGCLQFDTCTDPQLPELVFLYEIYTDSAAFADHLASPHFKSFDTAVLDMVAVKEIRCFSEVVQ
jgi:autoinducer 2-degrading protein